MNDDEFVPPIAMEAMDNVAVPVFLSVIVAFAEVEPAAVAAKVVAAGVRLTAGAVPVPFRATVCGEPEASSVIAIVPLNAPATAGAKAAVNCSSPPPPASRRRCSSRW